MMWKIGVLVLLLFLNGCLYKNYTQTVMVHPTTGDVQVCKGVYGIALVIPVWKTASGCISGWEQAGYKRADQN